MRHDNGRRGTKPSPEIARRSNRGIGFGVGRDRWPRGLRRDQQTALTANPGVPHHLNHDRRRFFAGGFFAEPGTGDFRFEADLTAGFFA